MNIILVNKRLALSGKDIHFAEEELFNLKTGSLVNQIGNGKENGTIRTDEFRTPVKYVGSIICQFDCPEKMYAFEVPESNESDKIYLLYGSTGNELFTESALNIKTGTSYVRFYKPEFKLVQ